MATRQGSEYWLEQVEDWRRSGLSQVAYCKQHNLTIKSFRRWRTKLQRAAAPALTLVPVSVSAQIPEPPIRLHSPGGWRIELPTANAAWLADLVRGLP
jgi:hypothetical protein